MSQLTELFTDIADAIREKKGTSEPIIATDFPSEISSITGGGGGDYTFGYAIDIQAQNTITKGDRIVAQLNDGYVTPAFNDTQLENGIVCMSKDKSVAIKAGTSVYGQVLENNYQVTVLFRNQSGQYGDGVTLTFTNFPTTNFKLYNSFVLNDEGTLAYSALYKTVSNATSYENVVVVIEIDKENKTAQYYYSNVNITDVECGGSNPQNYRATIDSPVLNSQNIVNSSGFASGTNGQAVGDYVVCISTAHILNYPAGTYSAYSPILTIYKYNRSTHSLDLEYNMTPRALPFSLPTGYAGVSGTHTMLDENTILFPINSGNSAFYYGKYNFQTKEITYSQQQTISGGTRISPNGLYFANLTSSSSNAIVRVYRLSHLDFSPTLVYEKTISSPNRNSGVGYASDDGRFVYSSQGALFDVIDEIAYPMSSMGAGYTAYILNAFLTPSDFAVVQSMSTPIKANILALTPSTNNAEYIASSTASTDCSTPNRTYGVASEDLAVGQIGQARALFVTGGGT